MKTLVTLSAFAASLILSLAGASAAASGAVKTNYDLAISFSLTAYTTGSTAPATLTSRQIIQGLNALHVLGGTNQFSPQARLVYRQVLSGSNVISTGQFVLDGSGPTLAATDVSAFVRWTPLGTAPYTNGTSVTTYSFDGFSSTPYSLQLQGFSVSKPGPISPSHATVLHSLSSRVSGTAVLGTGEAAATSVVRGTVTLSGGTLE